MEARIVIDVRNSPQLLWACRHALADLLREEANVEPSLYVASRLRDVAAKFEAGVGR